MKSKSHDSTGVKPIEKIELVTLDMLFSDVGKIEFKNSLVTVFDKEKSRNE